MVNYRCVLAALSGILTYEVAVDQQVGVEDEMHSIACLAGTYCAPNNYFKFQLSC